MKPKAAPPVDMISTNSSFDLALTAFESAKFRGDVLRLKAVNPSLVNGVS